MQNEYIVSTDKEERIDLKSEIVSADWIATVANDGQEAILEVDTVFVAEGSDIEITGYSSKGPLPGKIKGKIFDNTFKGGLLIPKDVVPFADIWFEANLPKHGVKMESSVIPGRPAIKISKLYWNKEVITREELVKMTCQFQSGVIDGDEVFFIVYEHFPEGCDLKMQTFPVTIKGMKAEIEWEFDYFDTTITIPTDEEMKKVDRAYINPQYYFIVSVNGIRAGVNRESGLLVFKDWVSLVVEEGDEPLKGSEVTIKYADGTEEKVKSDGNGVIKIDKIPPGKLDAAITARGKGIIEGTDDGMSTLGGESGSDESAIDEEYPGIDTEQTGNNSTRSIDTENPYETDAGEMNSGTYDNSGLSFNSNSGGDSPGNMQQSENIDIYTPSAADFQFHSGLDLEFYDDESCKMSWPSDDTTLNNQTDGSGLNGGGSTGFKSTGSTDLKNCELARFNGAFPDNNVSGFGNNKTNDTRKKNGITGSGNLDMDIDFKL